MTKRLEELEAEAEAELQGEVEPDNPLKSLFVSYVGEKYAGESTEVTIEMCVRALAEEFPEFLAPVCEQNFMLGYHKCEEDITTLMNETKKQAAEAAESVEKADDEG